MKFTKNNNLKGCLPNTIDHQKVVKYNDEGTVLETEERGKESCAEVSCAAYLMGAIERGAVWAV